MTIGELCRSAAHFGGTLAAFALLGACSGQPAEIAPPDPLRSPPARDAIVQSPALSPGAQTSQPSTLVKGEARVLRGEKAQALLHPIRKLRAAYSYDESGQRVDYNLETDLIVSPEGVARTPGSAVPDFSTYAYAPGGPCEYSVLSADCARALRRCPLGGERCATEHNGTPTFWFRSEPRNPALNLNHVTYFDYEAAIAPGTIPARGVRDDIGSIVCLGDSLGTGAHTVAAFYQRQGVEPDSQSWCGLLRAALAPEITVENASIAGGNIGDIARAYDGRETIEPGVVIIAAGMNDHVAGPERLAAFETQLRNLAQSAISDGARVVFVGFFAQNPLWVEEIPSDTRVYNEKIADVARTMDAPFVDMAAAFEQAVPTHEPYYHLTGDYMHHPNNYGQRIYFSLILPYLLGEPLPADAFAPYVQGPWSEE